MTRVGGAGFLDSLSFLDFSIHAALGRKRDDLEYLVTGVRRRFVGGDVSSLSPLGRGLGPAPDLIRG